MRPHLKVERSEARALIPSTDRYGSAAGDLVRCLACGHAQVGELYEAEALAEAYAQAADEAYVSEEAGQRATAAATLERIERRVSGRRICDLGCWVGFLLAEAERRGWRATGVEPSRFASTFARERLGLDVIAASMWEAPLGEGEFDAVVLADVIEHIPRPGETLDLVARLLRPAGVVYLALPDAGSPVARGLGARWWSVLPTHLHYFTRRSMATLLHRHGFVAEWMGTAPKAFSVRYYLERLGGYSPPLARASVRAAEAAGVADRLVTPNFGDRMGVLARER